MLVKGVTLQDLHFGHKATERMYKELQQFKDFLNNNEVHILNINGDYFDRKLVGNEPSTFYALSFFSELVDICIRKNIKLRVILGTRSHDHNQISTMFNHYMSKEGLDFKYFQTVAKEDILGMHVIYVPEEYPEELDYYKDYLNDSYAAMHGHGTWDFVNFASAIEEEYEERGGGVRAAPIFNYNEWKSALKNGFAIFGHIHKRQHKGNVYYSGSFTRWGYGDRSDKGFVYYEYDTETSKWNVEYKNNTMAPRYDVITVKELFAGRDLAEVPFEEIQKVLTEVVASTDNIRINLAGLPDDKIKLFRKSYENFNNVKIEVETTKRSKLTENVEPKMFEKYDYILNRSLPLEETVKRFLLEEKGAEIELDTIKELLSSEQ
jgi:hypothetical protein